MPKSAHHANAGNGSAGGSPDAGYRGPVSARLRNIPESATDRLTVVVARAGFRGVALITGDPLKAPHFLVLVTSLDSEAALAAPRIFEELAVVVEVQAQPFFLLTSQGRISDLVERKRSCDSAARDAGE